MVRPFRHIALKALLVFALTLQIVMPAAALLPGGGQELSRYLCNQSVAAVNARAQTELRALLIDLGLNIGETPQQSSPGDHCAACILPMLAITPAPVFIASAISYPGKTHLRPPSFDDFLYQAQGPPLGSRAPPSLS